MWPPHPHLGGSCPRPPAWCQPWTKVHSAKVCRPPAAGSVTGRAGYSHAFWVLSELPSQISIISVVQPPIKSRPAEQALAVGPVPSVPLLCPGRASDTATPHARAQHHLHTKSGHRLESVTFMNRMADMLNLQCHLCRGATPRPPPHLHGASRTLPLLSVPSTGHHLVERRPDHTHGPPAPL